VEKFSKETGKRVVTITTFSGENLFLLFVPLT
jgi:hypothetical protein